MILDRHGIQPNPARDPRVKLPREEKRELTPPTAEHVPALHGLLPNAYRLPLLVLDATEWDTCALAHDGRSSLSLRPK
jgi:hypothetical protein